MRAEYSCSLRPLHQNQIAAQSMQLHLNFFAETGVADDGVDLLPAMWCTGTERTCVYGQ
jgi:hypothetical protein